MGGRGARSGLVLKSNRPIEPGEIREIKSANEAKNFDELKQYMWDAHGITLEDKVSSLDFAAVRDNLQGLEDVLKEFPQAENELYSMVNVVAAPLETDGFADTNPYGRISLYSDCFSNGNVLRGCYSQGVANGQFVAGTDYADVLRHEAGHLLILALINKDVHGIRNVYDRVATIVGSWNSRIYEKKILDKAFSSIKSSKSGRKTLKALISDVSGNASKDAAEQTQQFRVISERQSRRLKPNALR